MWRFFQQYTLDTPCDTTLKWMPRIEREGFAAERHGWTVNKGDTLLSFGHDGKTDVNQNVYHSLQLTDRHYKLTFHAEGETSKKIGVKLQNLTNSKIVLNATVAVGDNRPLYFNIDNEDFGQYKITFTRENISDVFSISDIQLRTPIKEGY